MTPSTRVISRALLIVFTYLCTYGLVDETLKLTCNGWRCVSCASLSCAYMRDVVMTATVVRNGNESSSLVAQQVFNPDLILVTRQFFEPIRTASLCNTTTQEYGNLTECQYYWHQRVQVTPFQGSDPCAYQLKYTECEIRFPNDYETGCWCSIGLLRYLVLTLAVQSPFFLFGSILIFQSMR